jgi:hypothetical protein
VLVVSWSAGVDNTWGAKTRAARAVNVSLVWPLCPSQDAANTLHTHWGGGHTGVVVAAV